MQISKGYDSYLDERGRGKAKKLASCLNVQSNRVRLPAALFSVSLNRFFFLFGLFYFNIIFPFSLFCFILTADRVGHALASMYILSLSPEFYFGKGISKLKLLICTLAKLTTRKKP